MTIAIGEKLPEVTFRIMTEDGPKPVMTSDVFAGKTMVLFGVPGAFTPTCHRNHLPGFLERSAEFKARGVDGIAVTAVNDPFVMGAWAKATNAGEAITFLADGSAEFAKASGLDLDAAAFGLGTRVKRFSMLVEDGVVKRLNVEDTPGKAEVSGAEALLNQL